MKSKIWIVAILFVIGVVAAVAIARSSQGGPIGEWDASGFIEADIISIAPEIAGRVVARPVSESDQVEQGDVLLKLQRHATGPERWKRPSVPSEETIGREGPWSPSPRDRAGRQP